MDLDGEAAAPSGLAVVALAAALGWAIAGRHGVGVVHDDADYVLAAKSLAAGAGFFRKLLDARLLHGRLPGFPLLLAPFAASAGPPFTALKLLPGALTLASCGLLWALCDGWLGVGERLAVLALYAFNPLVLDYAGRLMSEALFTAVVLAALLLVRRLGRRDRAAEAWLLGSLLSLAAVIRGEGLLLAAAVTAGLWKDRRGALARALGLAAALAGPVLLGNYFSSHSKLWLGLIGRLGPWYGLAHGLSMLQILAWVTLRGAPRFPAGALESAGAWALALLFGFLFVRGLSRLERRDGDDGPALRALSAFVLLYFLLHALWPVSDPRFFIVLVPLALPAIAAGAPARRPIVAGGLALWLASYAAANARALSDDEAAPAQTLAWIGRGTPASARVWGFYDSSMVELYTGRAGVSLTVPDDADAFLHALHESAVDYVFYGPERSVVEPGLGLEGAESAWRASRDWAAASPRAFQRVYANPGESTVVYRLLPDASFEKGYALYLSARREFEAGRWESGLRLLDQALAADPRLVCALNAYGATAVITGSHVPLGLRRLREALRLRPDDELARANLARLFHRIHQP